MVLSGVFQDIVSGSGDGTRCIRSVRQVSVQSDLQADTCHRHFELVSVHVFWCLTWPLIRPELPSREQ